jgi:methylenetetrahydrofolate reductase (NADPH)
MTMQPFAEALQSGKFLVTAELNPPKGTNLAPVLTHAERLSNVVDAFNLTDSHSARLTMAPLAVARLLVERGIEPMLQVTCRDRNRLALQSDLLGAYALGIHNLVCMTGDNPGAGDHPDARPVFDLDVLGLMRAVATLQAGTDLGEQPLQGTPTFCVGAVVNPGAPELDRELRRMEDKIALGAKFLQTQAVYDPETFARFMHDVRHHQVAVLASCIVLRSGGMARRLQGSLPGLSIPAAVIEELDQAVDPAQKGLELASRIIRDLKDLCQGVHLITIGQERRVPQILQEAGLLQEEDAGA